MTWPQASVSGREAVLGTDGQINTADKTREQELLNGTNTTRAWNGYTLPLRP